MIFKTHRNFRLGLTRPLTDAAHDQLINSLDRPDSASAHLLRGRAQADHLKLAGWGEIVVKHYIRGGWMRFISHRRHLRGRASRGEKELQMLLALRKAGLPVPEPLGWAERGQIFVHNWLVMVKIPHAKTLAEVAHEKPVEARKLTKKVSALIERLVQEGVHHVDLHPGNVLVDHKDDVHLIDFDKAAFVKFSAADIRERVYRRWNRAIIKHQLSDQLTLPVSPEPESQTTR